MDKFSEIIDNQQIVKSIIAVLVSRNVISVNEAERTLAIMCEEMANKDLTEAA